MTFVLAVAASAALFGFPRAAGPGGVLFAALYCGVWIAAANFA